MASTRNDNKILNIAARDLRIHPVAQRRIVKSHLKRIVADLDLDAIGTIHIVQYEINGDLGYWVIDGQHRIEALHRHGFGDWKVKCELHKCETDQQAAALFLKLNRRAAVGAYDLFVNEFESGDESAQGIVAICTALGLDVSRNAGDGKVCCVNALKVLHRKDNGETLRATLTIVLAAAGRAYAAYDGKLLLGLGQFIGSRNGTLDHDRLTKLLAKYPGGPNALLGNAKGLAKLRTTKQGLASCVSELVGDLYDRRPRRAA